MAIDPSIALRVEPLRMASPANMLSQIAQLRAAQQQEQFNAMRMAQAQREMQEAERFNALMARGGASPQELIQTAQGRAALKSVGEAYKTEQEGRKEQRLAQQAQFKLGADQLGAVRQTFAAMAALPDTELTRDKVVARLMSLQAIGVPREVIEATVAQVSDDPAANRREIDTVLRAGMSPKEVSDVTKPDLQAVNIGGKNVYIDFNPRSPTFRQEQMVTPEAPFTLSAGQVRFSGGQPVAGAPFAPRPEPAAPTPPAPTIAKIRNPQNPAEEMTVDARVYVQGTGPGSPGVIGVSKPEEAVLPVKEKQKREALLPKATQSLKAFEDNSDKMVELMTRLKDHPSLGAILGPIESRLPSVFPGATNAEALFDQIIAKGAFSELQDMRNASTTGGALGNVSNFEVQQLRAAFAALNRSQSPEDFRRALDDAIGTIQKARERVRDAYEETYAYRQAEPAREGGGWSVVR